jgi:hypothetical protein
MEGSNHDQDQGPYYNLPDVSLKCVGNAEGSYVIGRFIEIDI